MTPGGPYIELHCHSAYSFLDGVSLPEELAQRAGELGYPALALTDHNSVSGSMELAQVAADYGVRAIHGAELDLARDPVRGAGRGRHITLLVRDGRGWGNLCRILTLAHAHTRDGSPRRGAPPAKRVVSDPSVSLQAVLDHADGLVCLTAGSPATSRRPGDCSRRSARRACTWSCSAPMPAMIAPAIARLPRSPGGWD